MRGENGNGTNTKIDLQEKEEEEVRRNRKKKKRQRKKISSETSLKEGDESTNPDDDRKSETQSSSKETEEDVWNHIEEEDKIIAVFRDTDKLLLELGKQIKEEEGGNVFRNSVNGNKVPHEKCTSFEN